jgi:hypothetical protein
MKGALGRIYEMGAALIKEVEIRVTFLAEECNYVLR